MEINQLNYCDFGDFSAIKDILQCSFEVTDFERIQEAYKAFTHDFYSGDLGGRETIERNSFLPKTTNEDFKLKYRDMEYTTGVDLPVLITNPKRESKGCVFIVGEDPLRGEEYESVIFSTPFGTHNFNYRRRFGKLYWDFSLWLLEQGYSVYYTDIKKVWMKKRGQKHKELPPVKLMETFHQTLQKEIDTFKPVKVVTFGKDAEDSIAQIATVERPITFIHPTFTASRHWKQRYGWDRASADRKFNFMKDEFNENMK